LSESCHYLKSIIIHGEGTVDDNGIRALTMGCKGLETIYLPSARLTKESIILISEAYYKTLLHLNIKTNDNINECKQILYNKCKNRNNRLKLSVYINKG
jgi:hypothetical protein